MFYYSIYPLFKVLKSNEMKKPLWAVLELPLKTTKEIVWTVLTDPKCTSQYRYNCQVKCNWSAGAEVQWVEQHDDETETVHV